MPDQQPASSTVGSMVDGAPWWVKAGLTIYMTVGLPVSLVIWDKLQEAGVIPNPMVTELEDLRGEMQELKGAVIQQGGSMKDITAQLAKYEERRQLKCALNAKTPEQTRACFPFNKEQ